MLDAGILACVLRERSSNNLPDTNPSERGHAALRAAPVSGGEFLVQGRWRANVEHRDRLECRMTSADVGGESNMRRPHCYRPEEMAASWIHSVYDDGIDRASRRFGRLNFLARCHRVSRPRRMLVMHGMT
jgi:hypothetical protein